MLNCDHIEKADATCPASTFIELERKRREVPLVKRPVDDEANDGETRLANGLSHSGHGEKKSRWDQLPAGNVTSTSNGASDPPDPEKLCTTPAKGHGGANGVRAGTPQSVGGRRALLNGIISPRYAYDPRAMTMPLSRIVSAGRLSSAERASACRRAAQIALQGAQARDAKGRKVRGTSSRFWTDLPLEIK